MLERKVNGSWAVGLLGSDSVGEVGGSAVCLVVLLVVGTIF